MDTKKQEEFVLRSTTGDMNFTVLDTSGEERYGDPVWVNRGDRVLVSFDFVDGRATREGVAEITAEGKILLNERYELEEGKHDLDQAGHGIEFVRRYAMLDEEKRAWLAIRKNEGLRIDPSVAVVAWCYGQVMDPYDVEGLPDDCICVGRLYFARQPDSDIWVSFHDLPESAAAQLWNMHRRQLAFPAGSGAVNPPSRIY